MIAFVRDCILKRLIKLEKTNIELFDEVLEWNHQLNVHQLFIAINPQLKYNKGQESRKLEIFKLYNLHSALKSRVHL